MMSSGPVGPTHPASDDADQTGPTPHEAALTYDRDVAPFALPFAEAAVDTLLDLLQGTSPTGTVLDHGSGTGQVARLIHAEAPSLHVHCLDPNESLLSAAPHAPHEPWATVQVGTANDLASSPMFCGAISNLVLPFTTDTIGDLRAIGQRLEVGAPFVAVTLGDAQEVSPFHAFWSAWASLDERYWYPDRYVHFRFANSNVLTDVFNQAGYQVNSVTNISGIRQITTQHVWEWLIAAMPIGFEDGYVTPTDKDISRAKTRFLARETRKRWNTTCRMVEAEWRCDT
jgi:SAM-dependent methyltransferase